MRPNLVLSLAVLTLLACSSSAPSSDPSNDASPDSASGALDGGKTSTEAGSDGDARAEASVQDASDPLLSDPLNCGKVGHECGGGGCALGQCLPVVWRSSGGYFSDGGITVDDQWLYFFDVNDDLVKADKAVKNGPVQVLAALSNRAQRLQQTAADVFFDFADEIDSVPKTGGPRVQRSLSGLSSAYRVDEQHLFVRLSATFTRVSRQPIAGGPQTLLPSGVTSLTDAYGFGIVADTGTDILVSGYPFSFSTPDTIRIPKDGSAANVLVPGAYAQLGGVSSTTVVGVWSNTACGGITVWTAPRSGGSPKTVYVGPGQASDLVVDEDAAYVVDRCESVLHRVALATGVHTVLHDASGYGQIGQLAQDAKYLYFSDSSVLLRLAK